MRRIFVITILLHAVAGMLIPEDTEILDGYAPMSIPEISPHDDYFEARSMSAGPLFNSIRNKRSPRHEIQESDGLVSHFRPNSVNGFATIFTQRKSEALKHPEGESFRALKNFIKRKKQPEEDEEEEESTRPRLFGRRSRERRSADSGKKVENETKNDNEKSTSKAENLPSAMKLTKTSNGFASSSSRNGPSAAALVSGKWPRSPFEYSKIQHEEDSLAMDTSSSTMNEGMKTRTPRVNFVTQQKKSLDHDENKAGATKSEFYKSPPLLHGSSKESSAASASSTSERYPERSSTMRPTTYPDYKNRDMNSNRYDDRYIEDMYPPPPEIYDPMYENYRQQPPYDPYMARMPYPEYNNYPGSRYDVPDYRDYPPLYGNDIDSRYYMRSDMMPPPPISPASGAAAPSSTLPRKRMIYYAYLPEVVRSPPTVDLRYRSYDRYDPYYDYSYPYYDQPMMSGSYRRPVPERQAAIEKPPMRSREYSSRTSRPLRIHDEPIKNSSISPVKEKRFDQDSRSYYDDVKRSMYTYSYRRPSEYDSASYY